MTDYADLILRLTLTYSLSQEDAQDICQDVFLKLLEQKRQFVDFRTRKGLCPPRGHQRLQGPVTASRPSANLPHGGGSKHPRSGTGTFGLLEAIRALPEHYGATTYLFYYEGYSLNEVAKLCGCTPATVRKRLSRARKLLAKELEVVL